VKKCQGQTHLITCSISGMGGREAGTRNTKLKEEEERKPKKGRGVKRLSGSRFTQTHKNNQVKAFSQTTIELDVDSPGGGALEANYL